MKPVIGLIRKPDGAPAVSLVDSPEGPPVTADELTFLLRVAYLKLGKSTVDKAIAATSYEDTLARFAKPDPVRAYLAEVCGWAPGEVPADSVLLDAAEQLFCADKGDPLAALDAAEEAPASLNAIAQQRDSERAERGAERKAWARLLAAERAHHDHTLLLSDAERDDDMKGPRAAVVEAEEALLALGVDPEDSENLRGQLDRQDDAETAADRNHPPDAEFPNYAAGGAADSLPPALSPDERRMALGCITWLEVHAIDIEAKVDDECDGCDADAFYAQAATIRDAAREMAKAFGVEMPR